MCDCFFFFFSKVTTNCYIKKIIEQKSTKPIIESDEIFLFKGILFDFIIL